jgi:hypothetical protein
MSSHVNFISITKNRINIDFRIYVTCQMRKIKSRNRKLERTVNYSYKYFENNNILDCISTFTTRTT